MKFEIGEDFPLMAWGYGETLDRIEAYLNADPGTIKQSLLIYDMWMATKVEDHTHFIITQMEHAISVSIIYNDLIYGRWFDDQGEMCFSFGE